MSGLAEKIQTAWHNKSAWLILLRPLSWLYRGIFLLQKYSKQKQAYRAPVPVMIIGNITVGGSGKTPLIIALVHYLKKHQIQVGVISRGYGGQGEFPALVTMNSLASQVGDEPSLIVQNTQVAMAVGANRQQTIELLLQHYPDTQLILSDDGLQHFALQRDIEWVVIDSARGFGNEKLLPEGFLREPLSRLQDVTVVEHHPRAQAALNMHLDIGQPYSLAKNTTSFDPAQVFAAVVGIGYPERFFHTLKAIDLKYVPHIFPDHHQYTADDLQVIQDSLIITTAKDAVKIRELWHDRPDLLQRVWVVPVEAILSEACYHVLQQQLAALNIHLNPLNTDS